MNSFKATRQVPINHFLGCNYCTFKQKEGETPEVLILAITINT